MNYYLLGVKEADKYRNNSGLKKFLNETVKNLDIKVVAEDTNREILRKKIKESNAKSICGKLKVKYIPCDPLNKEKKLIGYNKEVISKFEDLRDTITTKESDEVNCEAEKEKIKPFLSIKELVWHRVLRNKLEGKKVDNILIVCDSWHTRMNTLATLLKNRGNNVNIIDNEWSKQPQNIFSYIKTKISTNKA